MRSSIGARALWCAFAVAGMGAVVQAQDLGPAPPGDRLTQPPETDPQRLAAGKEPWEEYGKFISNQIAVTALGPDLFGDEVNLANGALSFSATDVSLPGNSKLPVAVRRTFKAGAYPAGLPADAPFGDWDLDVPRIVVVRGTDWPSNRCSYTGVQPNIDVSGTAYTADDYWQGMHAEMPGGGELLVADNMDTPRPTTVPTEGVTSTNTWVTPSFTYFHCLTNIAGGGEGFLAVTADGTTYRFDKMAQYAEAPLMSPLQTLGAGTIHALSRKRHVLYASQVKDRFGHTVDYSYSNPATGTAKLDFIQASDGRRIDLIYTSGRISKVTAHGREWNYAYASGSLDTVTLEDGSLWDLDLQALAAAEVQLSEDLSATREPCGGLRTALPGDVSGSVTHPSKAKGNFVLRPQRHGRSNVPKICLNVESPTNNPNNDTVRIVRDYHAMSLLTKTVEGQGLAPMTWTYDYAPNPSWAVAGPPCQSDACAKSSTTTVSGPSSDWRKYTFGNSYQYNEGKLRKVERGTGASNILQTELTTFELATSDQDFPTPIGTSRRTRGDGFVSEQERVLDFV